MHQKDVVAANGLCAVAIFDEENQKNLAECLTHQQSLTGILGKVVSHLLEQGQANFSDLLQVQVLYAQLNQGLEGLLTFVNGIRPTDSLLISPSMPQSLSTLSIDSSYLHQAPHPLAQD